MYQYPAPMLTVPFPQVLQGNLLPDAVSWFFASVLKGLQTHGQHNGCMAALVHLAFQIYEALVRNAALYPDARLAGEWWKINPMPARGGQRSYCPPKEGRAVSLEL